MVLAYKSVDFELTDLKVVGEGWKFSGYASTFGNVDLGGDVILRGAFANSLKARPRPKLLWQHDIGEPLGTVVSLQEDDRGLFGEFKLSKTARGSDAYQLMKDGALDSMSIGYIATDSEFEDDGIRKLNAVDLVEISVVTLPMNEQALITAVKAAERLPLSAHADRLLEDARLFAARYQDLAALRARDGRQPGEAVRVAVSELKALAASLELSEPAPDDAPVDEPSAPRGTSARLELARRRLVLLGA